MRLGNRPLSLVADRWLLLFVALAFALRLGWVLWTQPVPPILSDPEYYDATARSLARGDGYSVLVAPEGFLPGGVPTAFWPPGYSFFLAPIYRVFGESLLAAEVANVVLGSLTVVLVYLIGLRLLGRGPALLAAGAAAVQPSLVIWTPVLFPDALSTFLFAAACVLVIYAVEDGRISLRRAVVIGAVVGVGALVRGQVVVLLAAAALWWWLSGVRPGVALRAGVVSLVAAAAVVLPWTVRNVIQFDSFVLLSTNLGYNLRIGHAPYSLGHYMDPTDLWEAAGHRWDERLYNETGADRAVDYALSHPERELELSWQKVRWLWNPDTDAVLWIESYGETPLPDGVLPPLKRLQVWSHWTVLALSVSSLLLWRSRREGLLFVALVCLAWTAVHVVFFGEPRYHVPLLPLLLPLAAASVLAVAGLIVRGLPRHVGVAAKRL